MLILSSSRFIYFCSISHSICSFIILGLHFSLPCVESHEVVDMRTITLSVPPQEVSSIQKHKKTSKIAKNARKWSIFGS